MVPTVFLLFSDWRFVSLPYLEQEAGQARFGRAEAGMLYIKL